MLSITVILARVRVSWNVRTIPSRATRKAGRRASDRPSNSQRPRPARSKPVRTLKSVVLPAPFGPMRAVITPRWTSRYSTSTAARPPKSRRTRSTVSNGSGLATPGSGATSPKTPVLTLIDELLLSAPQDALGTECHEQHQAQAHEGEADRPHVGGVQERDVAVGDRLGEEPVGALEEEPEEHGSEDGAEHTGRPAHDHHDV